MDYQLKSSRLKVMGYLFWIILLIFSILFYEERVIFMDAAFQLFEVLNYGSFQIYAARFTSVITQAAPLLFSKLGLPLHWSLLSYSISFIAMYGFIYHLIVRYLKNDLLGWAMIFFFCLLVFEGFYYPVAELKLGVAFLLLFFAILLKHPQPSLRILLLLGLITIPVCFTHRLVFAFYLFLAVFFLLSNKALFNKQFLGLFLFAIGVITIQSKYFTNWYDRSKQVEFWDNYEKYFPNFHQIPSHQTFFEECLHHYYFFPILLIAASLGYLFHCFKKHEKIASPFLKLGLILGFSVSYIVLVHLSAPITFYRFYHETNYLPLSLVVTIPFLFDFIPAYGERKSLFFIFGVILLIRLNTICFNHKVYTKRLAWMEEKMETGHQSGHHKIIIPSEEVPFKKHTMDWAASYESLLLSRSRRPNQPASLLITSKDHQKHECVEDRMDCYMTTFKTRFSGDFFQSGVFSLPNEKYIYLPK